MINLSNADDLRDTTILGHEEYGAAKGWMMLPDGVVEVQHFCVYKTPSMGPGSRQHYVAVILALRAPGVEGRRRKGWVGAQGAGGPRPWHLPRDEI